LNEHRRRGRPATRTQQDELEYQADDVDDDEDHADAAVEKQLAAPRSAERHTVGAARWAWLIRSG
jgi:hypothetical protein